MRKSILALVTVAAVALPAAMGARANDGIPTRFGTLQITGHLGDVIRFQGRRVLQGDNPLRVVEKFRIGARDVLLVQETGGSACPALYYFVTVSASGAKATRAFGTCDELTKVVRQGTRIQVTMPGYRGPFEPAAEREKAARERHVFTYRAGLVTEKGKPVR